MDDKVLSFDDFIKELKRLIQEEFVSIRQQCDLIEGSPMYQQQVEYIELWKNYLQNIFNILSKDPDVYNNYKDISSEYWDIHNMHINTDEELIFTSTTVDTNTSLNTVPLDDKSLGELSDIVQKIKVSFPVNDKIPRPRFHPKYGTALTVFSRALGVKNFDRAHKLSIHDILLSLKNKSMHDNINMIKNLLIPARDYGELKAGDTTLFNQFLQCKTVSDYLIMLNSSPFNLRPGDSSINRSISSKLDLNYILSDVFYIVLDGRISVSNGIATPISASLIESAQENLTEHLRSSTNQDIVIQQCLEDLMSQVINGKSIKDILKQDFNILAKNKANSVLENFRAGFVEKLNQRLSYFKSMLPSDRTQIEGQEKSLMKGVLNFLDQMLMHDVSRELIQNLRLIVNKYIEDIENHILIKYKTAQQQPFTEQISGEEEMSSASAPIQMSDDIEMGEASAEHTDDIEMG